MSVLGGVDPVAELRTRVARWREQPESACSPVFWAVLICLDASDGGRTR
ncbi:hypothetical protein [Amycolatopsis sp. cmx-4-83]